MRFAKLPLINILSNHLIYYPTAINLNYLFSFGSLAGFRFVIQLISGILLARFYIGHIDFAFLSIEHIRRNINFGWLIRYIHANGASFFFIVVYLHILKNLYYKSYFNPRNLLWLSGIILFFLRRATAFFGYILPWGQRSYWGATIITNFFTAIPLIGTTVAQWLWGGFAISNATLTRFYSLHYLLPFIIAGIIILHLILLHLNTSNNPRGVSLYIEKINFYPYFYIKDLFLFIVLRISFFYRIFFSPNRLNHPDNSIMANPLITPTHIIPEWYFLIFYAILRSIPQKLGGIICRIGARLILIYLILIRRINLNKQIIIRSARFQILFNYFFYFLIRIIIILGWIGAKTAEYPYIQIGRLATMGYFVLFGFGFLRVTYLEIYLNQKKENIQYSSGSRLRLIPFLGIRAYLVIDIRPLEVISWLNHTCNERPVITLVEIVSDRRFLVDNVYVDGMTALEDFLTKTKGGINMSLALDHPIREIGQSWSRRIRNIFGISMNPVDIHFYYRRRVLGLRNNEPITIDRRKSICWFCHQQHQ